MPVQCEQIQAKRAFLESIADLVSERMDKFKVTLVCLVYVSRMDLPKQGTCFTSVICSCVGMQCIMLLFYGALTQHKREKVLG